MIDPRLVPAGLLGVLLLMAAAADLRARVIPNALNLAIALLAIGWWWAWHLTPAAVAIQIGVALGVFALFAACFAAGMMGGGDVKLIAALALWLPAEALARMLVWMALAGGALTLAMLGAHALRRRGGRPEIPYGVAIVAAALPIMANLILTSPGA